MAKSIGHDKSIRNRSFNPEKYDMVVCPVCKSNGYVANPKRQCCPKCGGFGFIKKEKHPCNKEVERE
jgi:DnaJ-class molecular chaperone